VISSDGVLFTWGSNERAECGVKLLNSRSGLPWSKIRVPTRVVFPSLDGVSTRCLRVCCSGHHNLAICELSTYDTYHYVVLGQACYSWGVEYEGELGHGAGLGKEWTPKKIQALTEAIEVHGLVFVDAEDASTAVLGVGKCTSYVMLRNHTAFRLNDPILQGEKLELLREFDII